MEDKNKKWLIGLALLGGGIYLYTRKPKTNVTATDINDTRQIAATFSSEQLVATMGTIDNTISELQSNSSKYITAVGQETYDQMLQRAYLMRQILEDEKTKRSKNTLANTRVSGDGLVLT